MRLTARRPLPELLCGVLAALLAAFAGSVAGADGVAAQQWYSVHLDGRKVGHLHATRAVDGDRVHSARVLSLQLERNGEAVGVRSEERVEETLDGVPLGFETLTELAGSRSHARARIVNGEVQLVDGATGAALQRFPWPAGALLAEGQRRALQAESLAAGNRFEVLAFDPTSLRSQRIEWEIGAVGMIDVHGTAELLVAVRQRVDPDAAAVEVEAWLRASDREIRRLRLPALGLQLEMLACDRACALAPVQPTDVLAAALVAAPRRLGESERSAPLEYRLTLDAAQAGSLAAVPGQTLRSHSDGVASIAIDPRGGSGQSPRAEDLHATRWLQSEAAEIMAMAASATTGRDDASARMAALESAVRAHLATKSLRIGYASALEAWRLREGDCTEHALLLAALARASGIPARVATGIAYAERFGTRDDVFVPHAWVLAWVDGRWQGYDAALARHGSGHIAFATGDGDPFRFYRGLELLGRMRMDGIVAGAVEAVHR